METRLELVEKEVKPVSLFGLVQVEIEMDSTEGQQVAMANALIFLAHKALTGAQGLTGKLDIPRFGMFQAGTGTVSWSINVRKGNP